MKKFFCFCFAILFCFTLCSCNKQNDEPESTSLPPLSSDEKETISAEFNYVYGEIIDKIEPDVLVLKLDAPRLVEAFGENVYIITNQADEWCINDQIEVIFSVAERPKDSSQYVRITAEKVNAYALCYKPIIYLYPETPTLCSVNLHLNGALTCTYPNYNENGWKDFTAYPDGTLIFPDGKEYYCLYWEGTRDVDYDFSKGFCVKGEDTAAFLEEALAALGLNRREANEFIVYWLPLMQNNEYNVISFQGDAYTDSARLEIAPNPDALIRVFMAWYESNELVEIPEQELTAPERVGFTVVEWGGAHIGA
jgi:hypothetical protein